MSERVQSTNIDEQSPLIAPENTGQDEDVEIGPLSHTNGNAEFHVESKSTIYLILLTLGIGGLQIVWSVELGNGSPYLISLGMSKALVAFVWLAGPLTGALVQPYIGILSDRSMISWGKRKPFVIAGAAGTVVGSLLLAYIKDIIRVFGGWSLDDNYEGAWRTITIIFATVLMWCLDFAINTVQAALRAFIVDNAPAHQQEAANSWASRITGVGNVLGYIFGFLDLPKVFPYLGNTEFKVLCAIASIAISSTVLISCAAIQERNPQLDPVSQSESASGGLISFFKQIFTAIRRLSPAVRTVCEIQFFHWIGWFPFLYYITTYVGQLYVNPRLQPGMSEAEIDALWATATRVGTFALLVQAIVSFAGNILLPFVIEPTYENPSGTGGSRLPTAHDPLGRSNLQSSLSVTEHISSRLDALLRKLQVPGLTLRQTWFLSQLLHALCMFSTFVISTPTAATVMVGFVGIPWALTLWAPFALISADIAQADEERRRRRRGSRHHNSSTSRAGRSDAAIGLMGSSEHNPPGTGADGDANDSDEDDTKRPPSYHSSAELAVEAANEEGDSAGVILGLHNVAVSAPQILATLICSIIFKALQKDRGETGDESVAWTLRLGGLATLVAAFFTWRMQESTR